MCASASTRPGSFLSHAKYCGEIALARVSIGGPAEGCDEVHWVHSLMTQSEGSQLSSLFRYKCACGSVDVLYFDGTRARCGICGISYPRTSGGAIMFNVAMTEQNVYFDKLYKSGRFHVKDSGGETARQTYLSSAGLAQRYLERCGVDLSTGISGVSILDIACGTGWITAGLMSHPNVNRCRFHAFDISPDGLEMLGSFACDLSTANCLEMSVQNADSMVFEDSTFDFVIGSSVLHHFDNVEEFLRKCRRILASGGKATFGEPFALGYGIGSASLMVAQKVLGTKYERIRELYNDLALRVSGPPEAKSSLVDKHLFFEFTFTTMARRAGFSEVEFIPFASREFYRESFIAELLAECRISDIALCRKATETYRIIFDIFDSDTYAHSVAAFNQIVLRT
jgi:ubiquinone/menaquinone biosynthesis C-methylase UbiE